MTCQIGFCGCETKEVFLLKCCSVIIVKRPQTVCVCVTFSVCSTWVKKHLLSAQAVPDLCPFQLCHANIQETRITDTGVLKNVYLFYKDFKKQALPLI